MQIEMLGKLIPGGYGGIRLEPFDSVPDVTVLVGQVFGRIFFFCLLGSTY